MKKVIIIVIFLLASSLIVRAQNTTSAKTDSIINEGPINIGKHAGYGYTINGKVQTSDAVKARLYAYAPSRVELLKYSRQTTWLGLSIVGVGISGIGATLEFINKNGSANTTTNQHNLNGAYILCGTGVACIFGAVFHAIKAHKHAQKSLLLYNEQYQ